MKFAKTIVRYRAAILILTIVLMIPAILGYANTRVNYDMLNYLPDDFETVKGQNELMKDFGKGAFSLLILENMPVHEVSELKTKLENVEHVDSVIWYDRCLRNPFRTVPAATLFRHLPASELRIGISAPAERSSA